MRRLLVFVMSSRRVLSCHRRATGAASGAEHSARHAQHTTDHRLASHHESTESFGILLYATIGPRGVRRPCVAVRCNPMRTDVRRCGDAVDGRSVRRPIRRKGMGAKGRPTYRPRLPPSAIARVARSPAPDRHRLGAGHAGEHGGAGRNSSRQARAGRGADSGRQRRTRGESKIGRGPDGRGSRCTAPARARALRATR